MLPIFYNIIRKPDVLQCWYFYNKQQLILIGTWEMSASFDDLPNALDLPEAMYKEIAIGIKMSINSKWLFASIFCLKFALINWSYVFIWLRAQIPHKYYQSTLGVFHYIKFPWPLSLPPVFQKCHLPQSLLNILYCLVLKCYQFWKKNSSGYYLGRGHASTIKVPNLFICIFAEARECKMGRGKLVCKIIGGVENGSKWVWKDWWRKHILKQNIFVWLVQKMNEEGATSASCQPSHSLIQRLIIPTASLPPSPLFPSNRPTFSLFWIGDWTKWPKRELAVWFCLLLRDLQERRKGNEGNGHIGLPPRFVLSLISFNWVCQWWWWWGKGGNCRAAGGCQCFVISSPAKGGRKEEWIEECP